MNVGTDKVKIGAEVVNTAGKVFQEIETLVSEVSDRSHFCLRKRIPHAMHVVPKSLQLCLEKNSLL